MIDDEVIETRPLDLDLAFRAERELESEDVAMNDDQDGMPEDQNDPSEAEDEDDKDTYITYKDIQAQVRRRREQPEVSFKLDSDSLPLTESTRLHRKRQRNWIMKMSHGLINKTTTRQTPYQCKWLLMPIKSQLLARQRQNKLLGGMHLC